MKKNANGRPTFFIANEGKKNSLDSRSQLPSLPSNSVPILCTAAFRSTTQTTKHFYTQHRRWSSESYEKEKASPVSGGSRTTKNWRNEESPRMLPTTTRQHGRRQRRRAAATRGGRRTSCGHGNIDRRRHQRPPPFPFTARSGGASNWCGFLYAMATEPPKPRRAAAVFFVVGVRPQHVRLQELLRPVEPKPGRARGGRAGEEEPVRRQASRLGPLRARRRQARDRRDRRPTERFAREVDGVDGIVLVQLGNWKSPWQLLVVLLLRRRRWRVRPRPQDVGFLQLLVHSLRSRGRRIQLR